MGKLNKLTKHAFFIKMNFIGNSPQCQAKVRKFQEMILPRQGRETSSINNKKRDCTVIHSHFTLLAVVHLISLSLFKEETFKTYLP